MQTIRFNETGSVALQLHTALTNAEGTLGWLVSQARYIAAHLHGLLRGGEL